MYTRWQQRAKMLIDFFLVQWLFGYPASKILSFNLKNLLYCSFNQWINCAEKMNVSISGLIVQRKMNVNNVTYYLYKVQNQQILTLLRSFLHVLHSLPQDMHETTQQCKNLLVLNLVFIHVLSSGGIPMYTTEQSVFGHCYPLYCSTVTYYLYMTNYKCRF